MTGNVIQNHTDLHVFQLAFDTSLEIHKQSLQFPKIEQYALADQIRRASKGICANIAERFAKQQHSRNAFRRYLLMAIGFRT
jgi:four helix bundle protein